MLVSDPRFSVVRAEACLVVDVVDAPPALLRFSSALPRKTKFQMHQRPEVALASRTARLLILISFWDEKKNVHAG